MPEVCKSSEKTLELNPRFKTVYPVGSAVCYQKACATVAKKAGHTQLLCLYDSYTHIPILVLHGCVGDIFSIFRDGKAKSSTMLVGTTYIQVIQLLLLAGKAGLQNQNGGLFTKQNVMC